MALYSPGGLNLADTTAPLILAFDDTGTTDVVFAVSASGDLTITPDGGDVTVAGTLAVTGFVGVATAVDANIALKVGGTHAAAIWYQQVLGEAGADRSLLLTGVRTITNGFTVQYTHATTSMTYTFTDVGSASSVVIGPDIKLAATKKFYLDGGGDTYIQESSANVVTIVVGGSTGLFILPDAAGVNVTDKFYLDGGGDTYWHESAANRPELFAGGSSAIDVVPGSPGRVDIGSNFEFAIQPLKKFYLDGGGDTYIVESGANSVLFQVGGGERFRLVITGAQVTGTLDVSSTLAVVGNIGFYSQVPTAKPTGVAVSAAGIHAALVTLNLIAA